jgi:predicted alpha/beta superfamily hydrolase
MGVVVIAGGRLAGQGGQAPLAAPSASINNSQRFTLASSRTKTTYLVDVARVESGLVPVPQDYRLPVIYVTDGNSLFPLVVYIANSSVTFDSKMPAALVVAIGYASDPALSRAANLQNQLSWRTRDLAPPGAADFLAFITADLKPFIAARYPVDPGEQTLAGHSLGGLFTIYALLNDPSGFNRYVASSPSLFTNDYALVQQASTFAPRFAGDPARLFVSVGEFETKERVGQDMIGDARRFVSVLADRKIPGFEPVFQLFSDESHLSVFRWLSCEVSARFRRCPSKPAVRPGT